MLKEHPVFKPITKLEELASKYNIKVTYLPKFHCEMNPIEGLWCYVKQFVRKRTNTNFNIMLELIDDGRDEFVKRLVHVKLWRRFWRVLIAYNNNITFEVILKTYFSGKSKATNVSHTRISNSAIDNDEPDEQTTIMQTIIEDTEGDAHERE